VGIALPLISVGISRESSLGQEGEIIELHARVAEEGGWQPSDLTARVGSPITLRLTSDDVVHGFAIGQSEAPGVDVLPGQYSEATLTFDRPGRYTYYCTRWCGPGHWRMRGTIEVQGDQGPTQAQVEPLYVRLGLDLDAPHLAPVMPARRPSAAAGEALGVDLPAGLLGRSYYEAHSPAQAFESLRAQESLSALGDESIWDLVALLWRRNTTSPALEAGGELFAQNCAACHGEGGQGDGVMANTVPGRAGGAGTSAGSGPADFTNLQSMLGASPAILHGKILRGGMGTGMPYFGPIFTNAQIWSLADFLWTFTMEYER
jgi:mono/diheme cytochrome c family protein/plastocyanin